MSLLCFSALDILKFVTQFGLLEITEVAAFDISLDGNLTYIFLTAMKFPKLLWKLFQPSVQNVREYLEPPIIVSHRKVMIIMALTS